MVLAKIPADLSVSIQMVNANAKTALLVALPAAQELQPPALLVTTHKYSRQTSLVLPNVMPINM